MSSVWDDPKAEKMLRRLAEDGQPASAIAAAMCAAGHFASRNAVIGKCMRIGLQLRGNETRYAAVRASAPAKPEHDGGSGLARAADASPPSPSGLTGGPILRPGAMPGAGMDAPVKPEHDGVEKAPPAGPAGGVLFTAVGRDACRWPVAGGGWRSGSAARRPRRGSPIAPLAAGSPTSRGRCAPCGRRTRWRAAPAARTRHGPNAPATCWTRSGRPRDAHYP